jgi:hypothetical protein
MPFDLALPIASAVALLAIAGYVGRPQLRMRTYNKVHGGLRVIEVAFILSRARRARKALAAADRQAAEFVVYMTLKTGS